MKRNIVLVSSVVALLGIGIGAWAYSSWKTYAPTTYVQESADATGTVTVTTVNTDTGTTTPGALSYTLAQVTAHNNVSSCYTAINGKVYDLTLWINMHPGGKQSILSICGVDGTEKFTAHHKSDKKPLSMLSRFFIGTLTQ